MTEQRLTLAAGTRLLHIGPYKTGTTALQGAFHQSRERLAAGGAVYAGKGRQARVAAAAVTGARLRKGSVTPTAADWDGLCAEVAAAGERRVMISSEAFCNAEADAARRAVEGLGGERVHVAVTLRPLVKIVPSQWQQEVKDGLCTPYEDWLETVFRGPRKDPVAATFWLRHRHDELVARWARAVGPDRLTVVVVDETDRDMQLRVFEELLGVAAGTLVPEDGVINRSLTLGEVELLRQLNIEVDARGWSGDRYHKVIRNGVMRHLDQTYAPPPDAPRITTPRWATQAAAAVANEIVAGITAAGVRVAGNLHSLTPPPTPPTAPSPTAAAPPTATLPAEAAAAALWGGLRAAARKPKTPAAHHR
ncbi:hypothetical protein [Streptomyces sp. NPDC004134]|uniref:hypothetical protein n=1 Tax=Streptomyces sp. NPDC004134 TaxID=3364691 RepID=UPI0036C4F850